VGKRETERERERERERVKKIYGGPTINTWNGICNYARVHISEHKYAETIIRLLHTT
jgi:hypothetical protein